MKSRIVLAATFALMMMLPISNASGRPFEVELLGANEAPVVGDPDGTGVAIMSINAGKSSLCYELSVSGIGDVTGAHVHRAPAGSPGPVVVPLDAPVTGTSDGCKTVDRGLLVEMLQDPSAFYVNVHTTDFPGGALRGQLG